MSLSALLVVELFSGIKLDEESVEEAHTSGLHKKRVRIMGASIGSDGDSESDEEVLTPSSRQKKVRITVAVVGSDDGNY